MTELESNINKFNNLSFDEQSNCIWFSATLLFSKRLNDLRISLYYFNGFYIKLYYDQSKFKILKFEADDEKCLDEFLNQIELEKLF